MSKLYILPNGNAVDPSDISAVRVLPSESGSIERIKWRVVVVAAQYPEALEYGSMDDAIAARDAIIVAVNEMRRVPRTDRPTTRGTGEPIFCTHCGARPAQSERPCVWGGDDQCNCCDECREQCAMDI